MELLSRGVFFETEDEKDIAIEFYRKALHEYPQLYLARLGIVRCYLGLLQFDLAKKNAEIYLEKEPISPEANLYMGSILYHENQIEEAISFLKVSEKYFPANNKERALAFEYMSECHLKLNEFEEAVECFKEHIKIISCCNSLSNDISKKKIRLGELYYLAGKFNMALETFSEMPGSVINNYEVWNNIGTVLWVLGDIEGALYCIKQSLELNPGYEEAILNVRRIEMAVSGIKDESTYC